MASNLKILKVAQKNLPANATNSTIIFTDNGKQYITLKDGSLLQITDIIHVDTRTNLPTKLFNNTFYFIKDEKTLLFYDGLDMLSISADIEDIKNFFLGATGKIKEEFLNEDFIVLKREYDAHVQGDTHISDEERIKWNNKFSMPDDGLAVSHFSTTLISTLLWKADLLDGLGKIKVEYLNENSIVLKNEYDAHVQGNTHISDEERIKWNNKFDLPTTGIGKSQLDSEVVGILNTIITTDLLDAHKNDTEVHVTAVKQQQWDAKYDKPVTGIPVTDLSVEAQEGLDDNVKNADIFDGTTGKIIETLLPNIDVDTGAIATHIADDDIHVTTNDKDTWNAKYDKPLTGIPETDLTTEVQAKIDGAVQEINLIDGGKIKSEFLPTGIDVSDINDHIADGNIHVTTIDKDNWNAKYDKPIDGINKVDLAQEVINDLEGNVKTSELMQDGKVKPDLLPEGFDTTAINEHMGNNTIHVTTVDKDNWNAKYDKPLAGIPETDLTTEVQSKIDGNVKTVDLIDGGKIKPEFLPEGIDVSDINAHIADDVIHVTVTDKDNWNNHKDDTNIHVTVTDKDNWNAKYNKPLAGIPKDDLDVSVLDHVNLANKGIYSHADVDSHIENDLIHNNSALGRWDYQGSQFDTAQKTNITIPVTSEYFELSKINGSNDEYESSGDLISTEFDTLVDSCPFSSIFYFGTYDRAKHTIKIYTRTGSTPAYDMATWGSWTQIDVTGTIISDANRYIQLKVELLSSDRFTTPQIKKIVTFYGRDIKDELKEAVGGYGSLSERLDAMDVVATHVNRTTLDKITEDHITTIEKIKDSYVKSISVPTTQVVIPSSEHNLGKADYDIEVKVFLIDSDSNLVPYSPKEWFIKDGQVTITFSTDVPFIGTIIIK